MIFSLKLPSALTTFTKYNPLGKVVRVKGTSICLELASTGLLATAFPLASKTLISTLPVKPFKSTLKLPFEGFGVTRTLSPGVSTLTAGLAASVTTFTDTVAEAEQPASSFTVTLYSVEFLGLTVVFALPVSVKDSA